MMDRAKALIEELIEHQGWSYHTLILLLFRFIEQEGIMDSLLEFLESKAEVDELAQPDL